MAKRVSPIPEGCHSITPYLSIRGAAQAIDFYQRALGAVELFRMPCPNTGKLMHAEIKIGDSILMLSDEFPEMGGNRSPQSLGGSCVSIHLYVEDVDASFQRLVAAGAKGDMPPADMFWGDRFAKVTDPFGHTWGLATHKEDVPPEEMAKRAAAAFAQPPK